MNAWTTESTIPTKRVDYPVMGRKVAEAIRAGEVDRGRPGLRHRCGDLLAANKVPGIRAGVCSEPYTARMIVEHNNCQIVAMGARVVGDELAKPSWTPFSAPLSWGRHQNRLNLIAEQEAEYCKPEKL